MNDEKPVALVIHPDFGRSWQLRLALEGHGFATLNTTDGADGLCMAQTYVPDVILLEPRPGRLEVPEIIDQLGRCERLRSIPIIVLGSRGTAQRYPDRRIIDGPPSDDTQALAASLDAAFHFETAVPG